MRLNLRDIFYFNRLEKQGIVILVIFILIIFLLPALLKKLIRQPAVDYTVFEKEISAFEAEVNAAAKKATDAENHEIDLARTDYSYARNKLTPFPFNPIGLPEAEWLKLGLTYRQVKTIKNYEAKGGRFYHKEDLKKIYGISQSEYEILEPYIRIPEPFADKDNRGSSSAIPRDAKSKPATILVDINTADSTELIKVPGIGPVFARRIIKYRALLGGYYSLDQLLEVYGLDDEKLSAISRYCMLGSGVFRKFDLNGVTISELKKHPYLDYYIAKAIVDKRISSGNYKNISELREIPLIHEDLFNKLSNYVEVR